MTKGNPISQEKVNKIHKDKKTMSNDTLAEKYRMTPAQVKYVLYKRKPKPDISYEELNEAMDKIDNANKKAKSIIKKTIENLNNLIPKRK
tara:strand:- start:170 stop:439 length:270 start_codon:yes stop_codon:yes gene_type:complete